MERNQSLLDLSNPMVKKYVDFARDRGYATRGEIALYLPMAVTPEEVESVVTTLAAIGIRMAESAGKNLPPQRLDRFMAHLLKRLDRALAAL